ncbi:U3 small nucleolar RNA-associated protein 6-domain-containing protein [Haematococcus lacustris]
MADTVRYLMEEMIPELEELESKGYFNRGEIKSIVQKRQDFEYALKRRAALKRDFLRYIEYEQKLDELRLHRKKELGIKGKKGLAENGSVRRIHFIFERATRKFKADLSLWMAWIQHCKHSKSTKQLSKVRGAARMQAWDFEHTGNVASARALMQQGLRHCKSDEAMWTEYVRLEMMYVARLRARRAVLGLPNPEVVEDLAKRQAAAAADKRAAKRARKAVLAAADVTEQDDISEAAVRAVLTGAVVKTVLQAALSALPRSLSLCTSLLAVITQFSFPGTAQLMQCVPGGPFPPSSEGVAKTDSSLSPATEPSSAQWSPSLLAGHDRCCEVFEAGLDAVPTSRMHTLYAAYLGHRLQPLLAAAEAAMVAPSAQSAPGSHVHTAAAGDTSAGASSRGGVHGGGSNTVSGQVGCGNTTQGAGPGPEVLEGVASLGSQLLALCQRALDSHAASAALCCRWVDWALRLGQQKLALKAARNSCRCWPSSSSVWLRRLDLELQLLERQQLPAAELFSTLEMALEQVTESEKSGAVQLWEWALDVLSPSTHPAEFKSLQQLLVQCVARGGKQPVRNGLGLVAGSMLRIVRGAHGLEGGRKLVAQLLAGPPPGSEFFHAAIDMELEALPAGGHAVLKQSKTPSASKQLSQVFEAAVAAYGHEDESLWLRFAQHEHACMKGVGAIYWRATKALSNPDGFIAQFHAAVSGGLTLTNEGKYAWQESGLCHNRSVANSVLHGLL